MPPRTHQTKKLRALVLVPTPPLKKSTVQASSAGLSASVVADQYDWDDWTLVKGLPAGKNGAEVAFGSTKLASSSKAGSRQPLRPPTFLFAQWNRAFPQVCLSSPGDFSHTSPVSLSRTAAPPKALKTVNREALG